MTLLHLENLVEAQIASNPPATEPADVIDFSEDIVQATAVLDALADGMRQINEAQLTCPYQNGSATVDGENSSQRVFCASPAALAILSMLPRS